MFKKNQPTFEPDAPIVVIVVSGALRLLFKHYLSNRINILGKEAREAGAKDVVYLCLSRFASIPVPGVRDASFVTSSTLRRLAKENSFIIVDQDQYHASHEWMVDLHEYAIKHNAITYPTPPQDDPPNQINHLRLRTALAAVPSSISIEYINGLCNRLASASSPQNCPVIAQLPHLQIERTSKDLSFPFRQACATEKPVTFMVELNNDCNYNCYMCPYHGGRQKRGSSFVSSSDKTSMDLTFFKDIIDQIACLDRPYEDGKYPIKIVPYFRGEITLHPQWKEAVLYIKSKKLSVYFSTNGSQWSDEDIDFVINNDIDRIQVSINGIDQETHKKLRLNNEYEKVAGTALNLIKKREALGKKSPVIQVCNIFNERTISEMDAFIEYWLPKVDCLFITPENFKPEEHNFNKMYKTEFAPELIPDPTIRPPCHLIKDNLNILADGTAMLCEGLPPTTSMGHASNQSVAELIDVQMRQSIIKEHGAGNYENPTCKDCQQWLGAEYTQIRHEGDFVFNEGAIFKTYENNGKKVIPVN